FLCTTPLSEISPIPLAPDPRTMSLQKREGPLMRESFNSCYLPSVDPTAWAVRPLPSAIRLSSFTQVLFNNRAATHTVLAAEERHTCKLQLPQSVGAREVPASLNW